MPEESSGALAPSALEHRPRRLAANFIVLSGGELLSKVFTLAAFAHLARALGPADFGAIEFALAILSFFVLFVDCGLSPYAAREVAKDVGLTARLLPNVVWLRSVLALVALALMTMLVLVLEQPWNVKRLALVYALSLLVLPPLVPWVFQGRERMHLVAAASMLRYGLFAAGVFWWVRPGTPVWRVPLIEIAAVAGTAIFYRWATMGSRAGASARLDRREAVKALAAAVPIGASELVWALKIYSGTFLLGLLVGGPEVGWFAAGHRIVVALHTFVWLYFFNLLPSIARSTRGPFAALERLFQASLLLSAWLSILLALAGTVLASPLMRLLYGEAYVDAAPSFAVLVWLIPLAFMSGHFRYLLIGYDRQDLEFATAAAGGAINVAVNFWLVGWYGRMASAWSLVAAEVVIGALAFAWVNRTVGRVPLARAIAQPVGAGALGIAVHCLLPASSDARALSSLGIYVVLLALSGKRIIRELRAAGPAANPA